MARQVDDAAVINEILGGNANAFELLLDRYQADVARIVASKVPRESAPEVVHETFVRAYRSLGGYTGPQPFNHWLSRIAVRACHDHWRQHYRSHEVPISSLTQNEDGETWEDGLMSDQAAAEARSQASRREAKDLLDWALGHLTPDDRMVLTLTHLEEYTVKEAADMLGMSVANVKVRSFRARSKLRKLLESVTPAEG